jgi:hypothetical protein
MFGLFARGSTLVLLLPFLPLMLVALIVVRATNSWVGLFNRVAMACRRLLSWQYRSPLSLAGISNAMCSVTGMELPGRNTQPLSTALRNRQEV